MGIFTAHRKKEDDQTIAQENDTQTINKTDVDAFYHAMCGCMKRKNNFVNFVKGKVAEADIHDLNTVQHFGSCCLGKWLYGEGQAKFSHFDAWQDIETAHANAHLCSAEIVRLLKAGEIELALEVLNGPYAELTHSTQKSCMTFYQDLLSLI